MGRNHASRRTRENEPETTAPPAAPAGGLERLLARAADRAARPAVYAALLALVVLLGIVIRLPMVVEADDVFVGHADSRTYFNQAYHFYRQGLFFPLPHGGSGWPMLLSLAMEAAGIGPGPWIADGQDAPADAPQAQAIVFAYAFSAAVSAGLVVATYLLARQMLAPLPSLVAAAFVAVDPFLLSITTMVMADAPYATLVVLALAAVLKARDHPAWLAAAGACMAFAHMMRVNGLVMMVALGLVAALILPRAYAARHRMFRRRWIAVYALVFFLVAGPYLGWRAEHLPGAFDYGTNQRFFADDLWAQDDAYWASYRYDTGGERETLGDYLRTHTPGEAWDRLYRSLQWQVLDLLGTGGASERAPEGAALTPLVLAFAAVGFALHAHRREAWILPLTIVVTMLTFVWMYPLVRSVRYFGPVIPLATVAAMWGIDALARRTGRPLTTWASVVAFHLFMYAVRPLQGVGEAARALSAWPAAARVTVVMGVAWLALALAPHLLAALTRGASSATQPQPAARES